MMSSELGTWSATSYRALCAPSSSAVVLDYTLKSTGFDMHAQMATASIVIGSVCQLEIESDCSAEDLLCWNVVFGCVAPKH